MSKDGPAVAAAYVIGGKDHRAKFTGARGPKMII